MTLIIRDYARKGNIMKMTFGIICIFLMMTDIFAFINLRKYLKKNENKLVENISQELKRKITLITIIMIFAGISGIICVLFK